MGFARADAPLYSTPVPTFFAWHGGGAATAADVRSTVPAAATAAINAAKPNAGRLCFIVMLVLPLPPGVHLNERLGRSSLMVNEGRVASRTPGRFPRPGRLPNLRNVRARRQTLFLLPLRRRGRAPTLRRDR